MSNGFESYAEFARAHPASAVEIFSDFPAEILEDVFDMIYLGTYENEIQFVTEWDGALYSPVLVDVADGVAFFDREAY